jgi:hypothetical protein
MAEEAGGRRGDEAPAPDTAPRPRGLDYWLGTKEGRSRLLLIIWALSLIFMGIGYGLIFWIFARGGL